MKVRANPVQGTHSVRSIMPGMSRTLIDKIAPPEKMARRESKAFNGPKARKSTATKFPDSVVLEILRLCWFTSMDNLMVAKSLADRGVNVKVEYVRRVREGVICGHLTPVDGPAYI